MTLSNSQRAAIQAQREMAELEDALPDVGERQVVQRVRTRVLAVGDRVWDAQDWRTITEAKVETHYALREFKWMGNDHWHAFGTWALRLVRDA